MNTPLQPHQEAGTQALDVMYDSGRAGGLLIAADTGVGKTLMVLDWLHGWGHVRVLISVPAIARGEWVRQNNLHFEQPLPLTSCDTGAKVQKWCEENPDSGILVTSYQLLKDVKGAFDVVVLDECHAISNPSAGVTQRVVEIVGRSEETFVIPLSATPAQDRPDQLWQVLDLVKPGCASRNIWDFRRRFCEAVPNEWAPSGVVYRGLRADRAVDLQKLIASVSFQVRKADILATLPPLIMSMRYVKAKRAPKGLDWNDESAFSQLLELNSSGKLDATMDVLEQARNDGERRFVVFSYLRQTAHQIGERCRALGFEVEVVTGELAPDSRHGPIQRIRDSSVPAVLVCNIDAVGVSLDFTFCQTAVFAEQSWVPGKTSQALGRLIRLSSKHACNCIFVVVENSKEEKQAAEFCRKQSMLGSIIDSSRDEKSAISALNRVESDDEILRSLAL